MKLLDILLAPIAAIVHEVETRKYIKAMRRKSCQSGNISLTGDLYPNHQRRTYDEL